MYEWNNIFRRGVFTDEKPDPDVVKLVQLMRRKNFRRILDLGCGAGRHLVFLGDKGFEVYGIDISEVALKIAKKRLTDKGISCELKRGSTKYIDYPNEFFDAVLCINVIYHNTLDDIKKSISEIYRVLKRGGWLFITFISKRTWKYGIGKKIGKDTFIQDEFPEKGVVHYYSDEKDVKEFLKMFKIIWIKLKEETIEGKRHSHWIVLAEK